MEEVYNEPVPDSGGSESPPDQSGGSEIGAPGDGEAGPTDEQMDRMNAENIIAMRQEQDVLRSQGNEEGAAQIEEVIGKVPVSDAIRQDPQGYLDGVHDGQSTGPDAGFAQPDIPDGPEADAQLAENKAYFEGQEQMALARGDVDAALGYRAAADHADRLLRTGRS